MTRLRAFIFDLMQDGVAMMTIVAIAVAVLTVLVVNIAAALLMLAHQAPLHAHCLQHTSDEGGERKGVSFIHDQGDML